MDDLFDKKKETVQILDLARATANTKEEFKRLMEKVPDFKMRPVKVRNDEIKINEKDSSNFRITKKDLKAMQKKAEKYRKLYNYPDPVPTEMKNTDLAALCNVPIDWKMLTTIRPKNKIEEDFFSRLVELRKQEIKTEARDRREHMMNTLIRKVKNKAGVIETRIFACLECGEEFCNGKSCSEFSYESFTRIEAPVVVKAKGEFQGSAASKLIAGMDAAKKEKGGKKKSGKKLTRSKSSSSKKTG